MCKKNKLIDIYNDTLQYSIRYINQRPLKSYKLEIIYEDISYQFTKKYNKTNITVENCDVIESIIKLNKYSPSNKNNKMLVLNLASYKKFGGGVENGAMAQEEELFRKTDYGNHYGKELYPLQINEFVYTPRVYVVKDNKYNYLDSKDIIPFDGLAISGIKNPSLIDGRLKEFDFKITMEKIETIFKFALVNNNTNLVLGALGCGVYKNPPEDIVEIYNYCLEKYNGYFDNIIFSILSLNNNNFDIFDKKIIRNFDI